MAYLIPTEFVTKMVDAGESKIFMSTRDTVIRAYMAGAILTLAAWFAVTMTVNTGVPLIGALLFPVGFCMLYLFGFDLLTGVLYVVAGWMMVTNPTESALVLTLIIAMFLVFEGALRIVTALTMRYPHWGWVLLNGAVSLLLGFLIWRRWPVSGLWMIGVFVGIEMLLNGWSLIMLALSGRELKEPNPNLIGGRFHQPASRG